METIFFAAPVCCFIFVPANRYATMKATYTNNNNDSMKKIFLFVALVACFVIAITM
ncbi:MAG: hypothetical protein JSS82_11245 [Bacteroidetes bacterium]|nr:hypothetical protein [Bacteroidota bacterium]